MSDNQFDYIIIGGGTAGALLANRLSADRSLRVLLIEAGRKDDYHWIHIPVGYLYCIGNPRTDWLYQTEPDAGLNGRRLRYPRGKTLGGCSSINGMIYMRGQARDYDAWAQITGDDAWTWDSVLPAFRRHEDHWRLDQPEGVNENFKRLHGNKATGSTGEWRVEKQRLRWDILDAFAQAAQQAGIPATDDFNRGTNEGVGYFEVNQKAGLRWNTAKAFLRPTCYGRPNFELWTCAQATRLLTQRQADGSLRCTGVEVWTGDERLVAHASEEVVLSAGAVNSPQLLQLSGIGPGSLLQQHGIPTLCDLPGVGANLQDHLQIRAVYKVRGAPTLNVMASSLWGKAKIGMEYAFKRSGPMSMAPSQLGAFTRSDPHQPHPNLEYHVQPLSLDAFGEPLHPFPAFTASVCNLNPTSRGTVQITSAHFKDAPAIAPNYLSTPEDRQVAADSLRVTRRIAAQPALAPYQPEEWKPGPQYQSDEDLARLAGDIATTIFHPVGTTAMGRDGDPNAVLDSRLRVRDGRGGLVAGLRVVDAGAMPTITSGNTNSPTLMMAEKAAEWIRADRQARRQHAAVAPVPETATA
ncbi:GMC family oxidoreductase [Comamonas terrigena]|uniref:GMC family oxidoreductase n=2 Tax=Comamonas terrigena TaxID=32013 RepID=UPI002449390A|nr:GMC family oxidoreductase N-terminal domain-containing protein [Comamonas terrigena]MDH0049192.1 GMC family oxidoreductase N-terminal domain-containing protein [Comamonas terrigena]MDH0512019.1 GMC family oxidoreductase N-terminal domain-containing protein [Comamonas terrigena]MDH1091603.1 GMC family oxidoreductase N-terminal domain-containing protein [Comamonas terrigena]MDH1500416.1 GMC family oxidoreductase N-terminal domain-containing protein [Comamonas terrigena]